MICLKEIPRLFTSISDKQEFLFSIVVNLLMITCYSQVIPWVPLCCPYIFPDISPESKHHINDNRRAHSKYGCIDKKLADLAGSNSQPGANSGTNAKSVPLDIILKSVHGDAKLNFSNKSANYLLST